DCISLDWYSSNVSNVWNTILTGNGFYGLNWLSSFSASNCVPMCFSEIGVGSGSGLDTTNSTTVDDPTTMTSLASWITSQGNNFLYINHSPDEPAADMLEAGFAPNQQAVFVSNWGDAHYFGNTTGWW